MLLQEGDDAIDENFSTRDRLRHGRELLAALVPAADGQGDFQVLVVDLQISHATKATKAGVLQIECRERFTQMVSFPFSMTYLGKFEPIPVTPTLEVSSVIHSVQVKYYL